MEYTPQSITPEGVRTVRFREKVRGYHPDDVDAFVAAVAKAVEDLEHRVKVAESKAAEVESRSSAALEAEDSLRRTLVLAQRTADMAIAEARDEASRVMAEARAERETADDELSELRTRLQSEAEEESRSERLRLGAERVALRNDVAALEAHLARERERLRIYFSDQLRRVEEGEPGLALPPEMEGSETADEEVPEQDSEADQHEPDDHVLDVGDVGDAEVQEDRETEDDPFLAELRRAVDDDQPLGPRDETAPGPDGDQDEDAFDLFARGDDESGRFGSRLRRRK